MSRFLIFLLVFMPATGFAADRPAIGYLEASYGEYTRFGTGPDIEGESAGLHGNIDLGSWRILRFAAERLEAEWIHGMDLHEQRDHYELGLMMDSRISASSSLYLELGVQHDRLVSGSLAQVEEGRGAETGNALYGAMEYRVLWGSAVEFGLRGQAQNVLGQRRRVFSGQLVFNFNDHFAMALRAEQWERGEDDYEIGEERAMATLRLTF